MLTRLNPEEYCHCEELTWRSNLYWMWIATFRFHRNSGMTCAWKTLNSYDKFLLAQHTQSWYN